MRLFVSGSNGPRSDDFDLCRRERFFFGAGNMVCHGMNGSCEE